MAGKLYLREDVASASLRTPVLHGFWSSVIRRGMNVARLRCCSRAPLEEVLGGLAGAGWAVVQESRHPEGAVIYLKTADERNEAALLLDHATPEGWYEWQVGVTPGGWGAEDVAQEIQRRFIPPREALESSVVVNFWSNSLNGPVRREREIETPTWAAIRGNYSAVLLDRLAALSSPGDGGQLVIFTGPPGVGKTYAIRALLREWRPWCGGHYIVDPDEFFGHAGYMLTVALDAPGCGEPSTIRGAKGRWALVVVEDADELLTVDAKERTGQAFARLLNLTNGLVGQGLRLLVLLTTNEAVEKLHPAIVRPGRCLAQVSFGPLPAAQAAAWAAARGLDLERVRGRSAWTLAELYDLLRAGDRVVGSGGPTHSGAGF